MYLYWDDLRLYLCHYSINTTIIENVGDFGIHKLNVFACVN